MFRGDWPGSVKAAAWPTGRVPLAVALALPSYGQDDEVVVGWSDRLRIALAMLLQAFGGGFELSDGGPGRLNGSDYGTGYRNGLRRRFRLRPARTSGRTSAISDPDAKGGGPLAVVPLR